MKLAHLDPALRKEINDWVYTLTKEIADVDEGFEVMAQDDKQAETILEDYAKLRSTGAANRKVATELNAIKLEGEMLAAQAAKNKRKLEKTAEELKRSFYPVTELIKRALGPLFEQIRGQYMKAVKPFFMDVQSARSQAENTDLFAAAQTFYNQRTLVPLALHEPQIIRSYAVNYLRTLEALRDGKELFAFTHQLPNVGAVAEMDTEEEPSTEEAEIL